MDAVAAQVEEQLCGLPKRRLALVLEGLSCYFTIYKSSSLELYRAALRRWAVGVAKFGFGI